MLAEGATTQVHAHLAEVEGLKKLLGKDRDTHKVLGEKVSLLKDEVVVTYVHLFEEAERKIVLLYLDLNLSSMDHFQVIREGHLVDEE